MTPSLYEMAKLRARIYSAKAELDLTVVGSTEEARLLLDLEVLIDDMLAKIEKRLGH